MGPPSTLQVFANFLPKKCYNPISPPYSPDLPLPDYLLFPKLKTKLKGLNFTDVVEMQEAVKVQKEEFSAAFQKPYDRAKKPVYMPMELTFN
jgi:hypothetical protein